MRKRLLPALSLLLFAASICTGKPDGCYNRIRSYYQDGVKVQAGDAFYDGLVIDIRR